MCNVLPNRRMAFTICLSVLVAGCGIKWATNRVLSNPDAIAKVGAVYDVLTPRDTTEKIFFIQGDSIVVEKTDTIFRSAIGLNFVDALYRGPSLSFYPDTVFGKGQILIPKDTIRIRTIRNIRTTDTIIKQLPPDNRKISRLSDSLALYKVKSNIYNGQVEIMYQQNKTAEKRLIWMAVGVLLLGTVIGLLIKFKVKL